MASHGIFPSFRIGQNFYQRNNELSICVVIILRKSGMVLTVLCSDVSVANNRWARISAMLLSYVSTRQYRRVK
eukprot:CCRYP_001181-RE/>CCRYP_001181-RE protein AED:0.48 eAED:1.00 QI:0/0/0/1/0/0/2/0/72